MPGADPRDPRAPQKSSGWRRAFAAGIGFATLLALAATLGYVVRDVASHRQERETRLPEEPQDRADRVPPPPVPVPVPVSETSEWRALLERLGTLEAEASELRAREREQQGAARALIMRVQSLEKQLAVQAEKLRGAREASVPAKPASTTASGVDLDPLQQRLFKVETNMQTEGRARLQFQTKIENRLFNIEQVRDKSEAERIKAQEALAGRFYNMETRIQQLEERTLAFERKVLGALDELSR